MIKIEELNKFIDRYKLLEDQLNASISDKEEYIKISKEYSDLKPIIESIKAVSYTHLTLPTKRIV